MFFCVAFSSLFAERGIVVTMNDKYAKEFFLGSIRHLRKTLECKLPIEIWYDGDELSESVQKRLSIYPDVTFCNFRDAFQGAYGSLQGWHAKPFMLIATKFDEICLMDADVFFLEDPAIMFEHPKYLETGAFFFRDRWVEYPGVFEFEKYARRKDMYRRFIPKPSEYVPPVFLSMWKKNPPSRENPHLMDLQESGCIIIDKKRHVQGISNTIELTKQRGYVYQCIHGDKETFWMGLEMAQEPYTFNDFIPCVVKSKNNSNTMVHFVDGQLFYIQKLPIPISNDVNFYGVLDSREKWSKTATNEEREKLRKVFQSCSILRR